MNESERLLDKAVAHDDARAELEEEARAAGRLLSQEEKDYLAELEHEGNQILDTAERASKEGALKAYGKVVVADTSGTLLNEKDREEIRSGAAKPPATAGRIAD